MTKDFSRIPPALDSAIQTGTAEMLALPALVCAMRTCRQQRTCSFVGRDTNAPWCLDLLEEDQLALYAALLDLTREWALWLYPGSFVNRGAEAPDLSPLGKAAVEIIAATLPRRDRLWPEARLWRQALYRCKASKIGTKPEAAQQTTEN